MSSDQFDLFGVVPPAATRDGGGGKSEGDTPRRTAPRAAARADAVQPARFDASLSALATALPAGAHFGTSSWSFAGWTDLVYGESYSEQKLSRQGLSAYAHHPLMKTVGIDRTFYAPISEADFRRYATQVRAVAADFRFLVKAPMLFTGPRLRSDSGEWSDNPAFLNAGLAATQFVWPAVTGLSETCGPLVFQFPPLGPRFTRAPQRFADALAEFLLALPRLSRPACYAVEVRDPELLTDDYLAALCAGNATHCIGIHARMPDAAAQARFWRESGRLPLTIRWSLHSGFKYEEAKERYAPFNALVDEDPAGRRQVAELILEAARNRQESFVVANNKAEGSAPLTIRKLAELIAEHGESIVRRG